MVGCDQVIMYMKKMDKNWEAHELMKFFETYDFP